MRTPHKHAEAIKAWADGAKIEYRRSPQHHWEPANDPLHWWTGFEYRAKPEPVVEVKYGYIKDDRSAVVGLIQVQSMMDNLKVTFIDGKAVSAEIIK